MKAIVMHDFGGPEVLKYEDAPDPDPGPDEVLIDVHSVSVNPGLDFLVRSGKYQRPVDLPHVPGIDPAGVVAAVGENVKDRKVGDRVWSDYFVPCNDCEACAAGNKRQCKNFTMVGVQRWGGYAEKVVVPAEITHIIPEGIDFPEANVLARHFPMAMHLVEMQGEVKEGETVLVMGATGGLGNACVQVAKANGATVIAGAGSDERVKVALETGADHGINYREKDLEEEVMSITSGQGVNMVVDNVADPETWPKAYNSLAMWGRMICGGARGVGGPGGAVSINPHRLYQKRLTIKGSVGGVKDGVKRAFDMGLKGEAKPLIEKIFPLKDAAEAQRKIDAREINGKVVLKVRD